MRLVLLALILPTLGNPHLRAIRMALVLSSIFLMGPSVSFATSTFTGEWYGEYVHIFYRVSVGHPSSFDPDSDYRDTLYRAMSLDRYIASLALTAGPLPEKVGTFSLNYGGDESKERKRNDKKSLRGIQLQLSEANGSWKSVLAKEGVLTWEGILERFPVEFNPFWGVDGKRLYFTQGTLEGNYLRMKESDGKTGKSPAISLAGSPIPWMIDGKLYSIDHYREDPEDYPEIAFIGCPLGGAGSDCVTVKGFDEVHFSVEGTKFIVCKKLPRVEETGETPFETLLLNLKTGQTSKIGNAERSKGVYWEDDWRCWPNIGSDSFVMNPQGSSAVQRRYRLDGKKDPPEKADLFYWTDLMTGKTKRIAKFGKPTDFLGWAPGEDRALFLRRGSKTIESIGREGDIRKELEIAKKGTFTLPYDDLGQSLETVGWRAAITEEEPVHYSSVKTVLVFKEEDAKRLDQLGLLRKGRKVRELLGVGDGQSTKRITGLWIVLAGKEGLDARALAQDEKLCDAVISPLGNEIGYVSWSSGIMTVHRKKFDWLQVKLDP